MGISTFSFLFLCIYMSCVLKPWCKVNWDSQMYKKDSSILLHIKYIWLTLLLLICSYIAAVHILIVWLKNIYILVGLYLSVHSSFHVWLNRFKVVEGFGAHFSTSDYYIFCPKHMIVYAHSMEIAKLFYHLSGHWQITHRKKGP